MARSTKNLNPSIVEEKLKQGKLILVPKLGKSKVWNNISTVACKNDHKLNKVDFVACNKCFKAFKFEAHVTGTSHLSNHIEKCLNIVSSSGQGQKQLKLPFKKKTVVSAQTKKDVLNSAVKVVVSDLRPFTVLNGAGMLHCSQTLIDIGAKYGSVLPDRHKISEQVKVTAEEERVKLLGAIKQATSENGGIEITSDLWTDKYKQKTYLSCTAHWIQNGSRQNSAMFCELFRSSRKTGESIKHELVSNLNCIGVEPDMLKLVTFVTDQGANMKKALQDFSWLPCCCHILNVILSHAFKLEMDLKDDEMEMEELKSFKVEYSSAFEESKDPEMPKLDFSSIENVTRLYTRFGQKFSDLFETKWSCITAVNHCGARY